MTEWIIKGRQRYTTAATVKQEVELLAAGGKQFGDLPQLFSTIRLHSLQSFCTVKVLV